MKVTVNMIIEINEEEFKDQSQALKPYVVYLIERSGDIEVREILI